MTLTAVRDEPVTWLVERLEDARRDLAPEDVARAHIRTLTARDAGPLLHACLVELLREARDRREKAEAREAFRRSPDGAEDREYRSTVARLRREDERRRAELIERDPEEYRRRYSIAGAIEAFREEVRAEVLGDLMAATFELPDGRTVAWGEATVIEHRAAIAALMPGLDRALADIARHEEAIAVIESRGVDRLSETQAVAA